MTKPRLFRTLASFAVAGLMLGHLSCGDPAQSNPLPEETEEETPLIPVAVSIVETGDIAAFFSGTATLEAEGEATVVARVGGVVEELLTEEGRYVQKGDVLVRLDRDRLRIELTQLQANLNQLESDFSRNEELYQKQLISTETYEQIKYQFESQKAAVALAELQLNYTDIRAPISGIIAERMIKVGNMVSTNQATFRITDFDPLHAILHVPERELSKLKVGHRAGFRVEAYPDADFTGKIKRISPVIDPATGTFKVTVEVRDRTRQLKPGMFARVNITYDVHQNTLLVPKEAILREDATAAVFVIEDSTAYRRAVTTGYTNDRYIEVLSGISANETIVTTGQSSLKDSTEVEIINRSGDVASR